MSRIDGPSREDIARRGDAFTELVLSAIWHTLNSVTRRFAGVVSIDDLALIQTTWLTYVSSLRDRIGQSYLDGAMQTRVKQRDALMQILKKNDAARSGLVAAVGDAQPFEIPLVGNQQAESIMASAENRLSNVGNEVWEHARGELLIGLQNGEGIPELRNRVSAATDFTAARAELIARSEVASAMNSGALDQMRQIDTPGMLKEWIAVDDGRVRPDHIEANGEKIPLDGVFSNGLEPGEAPNCRCTYGFDIPNDDVYASSAAGCDSPGLSALFASLLPITVTFAKYDPEYARKFREKQRLKRQAERDAGAIVPTPEPPTPPPPKVLKEASPIQKAVQTLQRDESLDAVSTCAAPLIEDSSVSWFDDWSADLEIGNNARFRVDPLREQSGLNDRALQDAGVKDASTRKRVLDFNRILDERFSEPLALVENVADHPTGVNANVIAYIRSSRYGGRTLGINPRLFKDAQLLSSEKQKWLASGTGKIEDILVHEHGHFFLQRQGISSWNSGARRTENFLRAERAARAAGAPDGVLGQSLSRYAETDAHEAQAELWMNYHMGGASRPTWVIKWGETLMREMGLDPAPLCVDLGSCPELGAKIVSKVKVPAAKISVKEKVTKEAAKEVTGQQALDSVTIKSLKGIQNETQRKAVAKYKSKSQMFTGSLRDFDGDLEKIKADEGRFEKIPKEQGGGRQEVGYPRGTTDLIRSIDDAMASSTNDTPVELTRGVHRPEYNMQFMWADDKSMVGAEWVDQSFVSTAVNADAARTFVEKKLFGDETSKQMLMHIHAPAGTSMLGISSASSLEAEMLLDRGYTYRVIADRGWTNERMREIDVEVIAPPRFATADVAFASDAEYQQVLEQALQKIQNSPVPSEAAITKARAELEKARAGTGRAGGESRGGSAAARRKQRQNLFREFGGYDKGYVVCHGCGAKMHWMDIGVENPFGYQRFERGKIFVKCQGGGYQLTNLLPECFACNRKRNDQMIRHENGC